MVIVSSFNGWLNDQQKVALMEPVTKEKLIKTLQSFQSDKALGPGGWMVEFYLGFWDIIAKESKCQGKIHAPLNNPFIENI